METETKRADNSLGIMEDLSMENLINEVIPTIDAPLGEFLIVIAAKRTIPKSCSGQVIEALKRAKTPLTLAALASRVRLSKAGKELTVKDVKARVRQCAEWYAKNKVDGVGPFVEKTDAGYTLVRTEA